jgi:hypothetical protein
MRTLLSEQGEEPEFSEAVLAHFSREAARDPEWFDKLWHDANCQVSRALVEEGPARADFLKDTFLPHLQKLKLKVETYRVKQRKAAHDQRVHALVMGVTAMRSGLRGIDN